MKRERDRGAYYKKIPKKSTFVCFERERERLKLAKKNHSEITFIFTKSVEKRYCDNCESCNGKCRYPI